MNTFKLLFLIPLLMNIWTKTTCCPHCVGTVTESSRHPFFADECYEEEIVENNNYDWKATTTSS